MWALSFGPEPEFEAWALDSEVIYQGFVRIPSQESISFAHGVDCKGSKNISSPSMPVQGLVDCDCCSTSWLAWHAEFSPLAEGCTGLDSSTCLGLSQTATLLSHVMQRIRHVRPETVGRVETGEIGGSQPSTSGPPVGATA